MIVSFVPFYLGALGLVVLTIHGVGSRHYATSSVETGMNTRLSDGDRLLLHYLRDTTQNHKSRTFGQPTLQGGKFSGLSVREGGYLVDGNSVHLAHLVEFVDADNAAIG